MPLSRHLASLQGGLLQRQKSLDEQSAELGCHHPPKQSRCESLSGTKQTLTARVCVYFSKMFLDVSNGKYASKQIAAQDLESTYSLQIYFQPVQQPPKGINTSPCDLLAVLSGLLVALQPLLLPCRQDLLRASKGQCAALPATGCGNNFVTKSSSSLQEMQLVKINLRPKAKFKKSFWLFVVNDIL